MASKLGFIFLYSLLQCKSDVCNYDAITCTAGSSLVLEQSPRVCFSERGSLYHIRRHLQLRSFKNSLLDSFQAAKGLLTIRRMQRINGILNTKYKNNVNQASMKFASLRTARNSNVPRRRACSTCMTCFILSLLLGSNTRRDRRVQNAGVYVSVVMLNWRKIFQSELGGWKNKNKLLASSTEHGKTTRLKEKKKQEQLFKIKILLIIKQNTEITHFTHT